MNSIICWRGRQMGSNCAGRLKKRPQSRRSSCFSILSANAELGGSPIWRVQYDWNAGLGRKSLGAHWEREKLRVACFASCRFTCLAPNRLKSRWTTTSMSTNWNRYWQRKVVTFSRYLETVGRCRVGNHVRRFMTRLSSIAVTGSHSGASESRWIEHGKWTRASSRSREIGHECCD
jgi:hypothetical protein